MNCTANHLLDENSWKKTSLDFLSVFSRSLIMILFHIHSFYPYRNFRHKWRRYRSGYAKNI